MIKTCLSLFTTLALLATSMPALAVTTIKIATIVPDGTGWMTDMRAAAAEIEERTEGRVKFKLYAGGVQGTDAQVLRKMRIGQLHGGAFTNGGIRLFHPDAEIYGLPMVFSNQAEIEFVRGRMDAELQRRLEEAGYASFGFAGGGLAYLLSRKPIANREDARGLKIWIPEGDRVARGAADALGIAPVALPPTDVLTGLQTELIDTVMGPAVGVIVMQWHTAMTHITNLPIAYTYATLIIDGRVFSRLSAGDQAIVNEVMGRVYGTFDQQNVQADREALAALLADGMELVEVAPAEQQQWQALISAANVDSAADAGMDAALIAQMNCYVKAYRAGTDGADCQP
jgi:TRAP-type C4-dicarboxylate transport system substrate-binding protein